MENWFIVKWVFTLFGWVKNIFLKQDNPRRSVTQIQKSSGNSVNIQVGGNFYIDGKKKE